MHTCADTSVISLVQYLNNQLFTLNILEGNLQQYVHVIACYVKVVHPPTRLVLLIVYLSQFTDGQQYLGSHTHIHHLSVNGAVLDQP